MIPQPESQFYASSWTRTASYLRVAENTNINNFEDVAQCDLLYSFSGAGINHQVRRGQRDLRLALIRDYESRAGARHNF